MRHWIGAFAWLAVLAAVCGPTGCATVAEHRKLEHQVAVLKERMGPAGSQRQDLADLTSELEELRAALARVEGRLEVVEHETQAALREAREARKQAAVSGTGAANLGPGADASAGGDEAEVEAPAGGAASAEIAAYREAYAAWRGGQTQACIDRFQEFLQTYASSSYADDAAFWMADCYFKQGDYRAAILRFDDVASGYPTGNKAADALYRQGEALMRLGPGYAKAARRAFERVIEEYPDSPRVPEAKQQLEMLGTG